MSDVALPPPAVPVSDPADRQARLEQFARRLARSQNALPDDLQGQMTTRWSTLFD